MLKLCCSRDTASSVGESRNNAQSIFSINDGGTDHRADELKEQSVRVSDTELSGEWNPDDVRVRLKDGFQFLVPADVY